VRSADLLTLLNHPWPPAPASLTPQVRKARKSGQVYYRQYHEQIPVAQLCRETAAVMQEFTRERGGRGGRVQSCGAGEDGSGGLCAAKHRRALGAVIEPAVSFSPQHGVLTAMLAPCAPACRHSAAPWLVTPPRLLLPPGCPTAESGGVRPFGVSLLMAGYDDHGPQLYQIDPSGSYFAWKASGGCRPQGLGKRGVPLKVVPMGKGSA